MEHFLWSSKKLAVYYSFWLVYFFTAKSIFILYNYDFTINLTLMEISKIFIYGLRMDFSMAAYLVILPALIFVFSIFLKGNAASKIISFYTLVLLVLSSFVLVTDLALYPYWGTRINVTVFNYLNEPEALKASVSFISLIISVVSSITIIIVFVLLFKKWFKPKIESTTKPRLIGSAGLIFVIALLIIPIRGGFDTSPLNLSSVAFSNKLFANQSATNFLWNFGKSVEKRKRLSNPCLYLPEDESILIFEERLQNDSIVDRPQIINIPDSGTPNVIIIILESFSNKVIAELGGLKNIAPNIDSLCRKSYVFSNFYASGNRSDRGISAILGSYPSLLSTSIMVYPEKSSSLTLLPEYFNEKNYNTSFYYGGDINFYNLKSFVLKANYGKIVSKEEFPSNLGRMTKWGVPDGFVFDKAFADLSATKEPFFQTIYTTSSHPPYDVPFHKIKGTSNEEMYLNSVAYTDSCLGVFINKLRKSEYWDNTLLIVTSDHGTLPPGPTDITHPDSYRIPLIWSGGVISSIAKNPIICKQTDFGPSLIKQLGWIPDSTKFARDFFYSNPFAFYMLDSGWGYIIPGGSYYFDNDRKMFTHYNDLTCEEKFAKSFMQVLHDDFIKR